MTSLGDGKVVKGRPEEPLGNSKGKEGHKGEDSECNTAHTMLGAARLPKMGGGDMRQTEASTGLHIRLAKAECEIRGRNRTRNR